MGGIDEDSVGGKEKAVGVEDAAGEGVDLHGGSVRGGKGEGKGARGGSGNSRMQLHEGRNGLKEEDAPEWRPHVYPPWKRPEGGRS